MTEGPIWRRLTAFTVPVLIGELFQQLYILVDSSIVGNFSGYEALAAIGASDTIIRVLVGFFNGMSVGFTVVIARCFGARDRKAIDQAVNSVLQTAFVIGAVITTAGLAMTAPMLSLLRTPAGILHQSTQYLRIYFAGSMGFVLYNTATAILRSTGDVQTPLFFLMISSGLNIVLDLILVAVFRFGVAGAGAATVISQAAAAILSCRTLVARKADFTISPLRYKPDREMIGKLIRLGLPTGFQKTITSASNVLVLSRITIFGEACLAGWVVFNKFDFLLTVVAQNISAALATFVSQNLGAGKQERVQKGVRTALEGSTILFLAAAGILILARAPLIRVFGTDPEMTGFAATFICVLSFFKVTHMAMNIFAGALRGYGKMTLVTVLMISGLVGFRQLYLMIVEKVCNVPWMIGLSYSVSWMIVASALYIAYRQVVKTNMNRDL